MSVKMHLMIDGKEFPLWDMPKYIMLMCMIADDSAIHYRLTGEKARAAIARYVEWVKGHLEDMYEDDEEYENLKKLVEEHVDKLEEALEEERDMVVSILSE